MIDSHEIINRVARHEGIVLKPYRCPAGYLTIGAGRNLEANPLTEEELKVVGDWQHGITKNAALYLLKKDLLRCNRQCKAELPFWNRLDPERKFALLDMCFNLGMKRLLKFEKMLAAIEIGDYRGAAKECLNSRYAKQVGKRARCIANLLESGVYHYD